MSKKLFSLMAILVVASMILAACAPAATVAPTEPAAKFLVCQVTDVGGIDDKSFNATAWKGVQDSMTQLGVDGKYLESQQQTDYEKNINEFI